MRDMSRKSQHDPLTSINSQLASRPTLSARSSRAPHPPQPRSRSGQTSFSNPSSSSNPSAERETRESAERLRALELIRRKKRETGGGGETPSTVRGGRPTSGAGAGEEKADAQPLRRSKRIKVA